MPRGVLALFPFLSEVGRLLVCRGHCVLKPHVIIYLQVIERVWSVQEMERLWSVQVMERVWSIQMIETVWSVQVMERVW